MSATPLPDAFRSAIAKHYELDRELGHGGMAVVWLAHRSGTDESVALKVLRPVLAEALAVQRFLREIRIASSVSSPALLPLLDSGELAGLPYYVMPFADGGSLRDRLKVEAPLRLSDAVDTARRIATALAALHKEGFVHRDIKPENVLLTTAGEVFLADYGIAHALASAARENFTSTGIVVGTPPYMSPEQGSGERVDGRSDIYSLGCLLYEMLVGGPPFQGPTPQSIVARHMYEPPPSLRVVRAAIPERLESLVMRMLAKVPADRFDDADQVIKALDELGDLHGTTAAWVRTRDARRVRVAALAAGLTVIAVGAALYWTLRPTPLDPDRVIIFPFSAATPRFESTVSQLPMLVGSALDRTAATKWIDGHALLNETERAATGRINARRARSLARRERAALYVDGTVAQLGDSTSVQVRLHDVAKGVLVDSKTEVGGPATPVGDLVLRAVVRILPKVTGLEAVVDVSPMVGRNPAAVDNWLRGERAYRQSRMAEALRYLELAVATDSQFAPAAFRGAAAAGWIGRPERADALIQLALRHANALPERQQMFARSLERFLSGRADEAIALLRPLLTTETESADSWMLAGEVYLHLLPTIAVDSLATNTIPVPTEWPLETFARRAFERARVLDAQYSPPLAHLAEMAARVGDTRRMELLYRQLRNTNRDSVLELRMTAAKRCLDVGPDRINWGEATKGSSATLFHVGSMLRAGTHPRARACGMSAFGAVLADTAPSSEDWNSLVATHGMLVAAGRHDAAIRVVDSAMTHGVPEAIGLFVLDPAAGVNVGTRADAFVADLMKNVESRRPPALWLLTLRSARTGDTLMLARIHRSLQHRRDSVGQRLDSLITLVSGAYLARARGDTVAALRQFSALRPTAVLSDLHSSLWESLATERLAYAELLLATGDPALAHRAATIFDHPEILINDLFLVRSLDLRRRAADALGDTTLASLARRRLATLGTSLP